MKSMKEDLHKNLENDTGETTHETKMPAFKDAIIPTIPPEELEQRITREKHERNLRHDLAFCTIFVTLLLLMCYGQVESNSFLVHKVMKKNFIAAFKKVNNTQSYWSWIDKTVLPNFFPENHNESYAQISSKMPLMKDLHSHRIGTIRIMQIRKSPVQLSCKNAVIEKGCIQEMLKWQQDTNKYSEGWTRYKSSSNSFGYEAWQPWPVEQTSINPFFVIGYMTLSYKIHVFRLYELDYAAHLVTNVAYGAFILLLLYMVVSMATKAARSRSKYLCHVSTWAELVLFSLGLGTISIFYLKNTSGKHSLSTIRNSPWTSELLNFIILSRQCTDFNAILVFLTSFKIFGLLGMTHWLRPMVKSVVLCGEIMRSFSFIFLFVLVGYSLLFWGIFGYWFQRYNTLSNSLTSTMAALLGKSDFRDLYSHGGSMAASLYLIFMFSFAILLFDLGILLVSEATSKAFKEDCDPSDAPRLMGNRFQTLFDMLRGSNKRSNKS
uniref:Polycystin cation channel PKD1/PKD2 domain-containing protein n=1 Tax=Eptatretus burgeri TaxID=7764 RepID=A0A8C4R4Z2_EPTBU